MNRKQDRSEDRLIRTIKRAIQENAGLVVVGHKDVEVRSGCLGDPPLRARLRLGCGFARQMLGGDFSHDAANFPRIKRPSSYGR
jgi:hypothetical protein